MEYNKYLTEDSKTKIAIEAAKGLNGIMISDALEILRIATKVISKSHEVDEKRIEAFEKQLTNLKKKEQQIDKKTEDDFVFPNDVGSKSATLTKVKELTEKIKKDGYLVKEINLKHGRFLNLGLIMPAEEEEK